MKNSYFILLFIFVGGMRLGRRTNIWVSGELAGINYNSGIAVPFKQPLYHDIWRTNASIATRAQFIVLY